MARAEGLGFGTAAADYPSSYRSNDRLVIDDDMLARAWWDRLRQTLPPQFIDDQGQHWALQGLNRRFRFCRYRAGQEFGRHRDGAWSPQPDVRSHLTVMLYLNGSSEFVGGQTRFYEGPLEGDARLFTIDPRAGMAAVFRHDLWHDGAPVFEGTKMVLRTDVVYRRTSAPPPVARGELRHHAYVWDALELETGEIATACRDGCVHIWTGSDEEARTRAGGIHRRRQILVGHTASVTCLAQPSPEVLVSGSRDRALRLWRRTDDTGWNQAGLVVDAHEGCVLSLAPDGAGGVISSGADGRVDRHRSAEAGRGPTRLAERPAWAWQTARVDGRLAVAWSDGCLTLHEPGRVQPVASLRFPVELRSVALAPRGLWVGDAQGWLHEVTFDVGRPLRTRAWRVHRAAITSISTLAGTHSTLTASEDGTVRLGARRGNVAGSIVVQHRDFVTGARLVSGGRVLSSSYDGTAALRAIYPRAGESL